MTRRRKRNRGWFRRRGRAPRETGGHHEIEITIKEEDIEVWAASDPTFSASDPLDTGSHSHALQSGVATPRDRTYASSYSPTEIKTPRDPNYASSYTPTDIKTPRDRTHASSYSPTPTDIKTPRDRTHASSYSPTDFKTIMADHKTASILKISDEKTLQLIDLYYNEDCLYDTRIPEYKNKEKRALAAEKIAAILDLPNFTAKHVVMKFKNIRNSYSQELKKISLSKAAGDKKVYTPKVFWWDKMDSFMKPFLQLPRDMHIQNSRLTHPPSEWGQLENNEELFNPDTSMEAPEEEASRVSKRKHNSHSSNSSKRTRTEDTHRHRDDKTIAQTLKEIKSHLRVLSSHNDDFHDTFGKHVASLMRAMPPQKALDLQPKIISLITGEVEEDQPETENQSIVEEIVFKVEPEVFDHCPTKPETDE